MDKKWDKGPLEDGPLGLGGQELQGFHSHDGVPFLLSRGLHTATA